MDTKLSRYLAYRGLYVWISIIITFLAAITTIFALAFLLKLAKIPIIIIIITTAIPTLAILWVFIEETAKYFQKDNNYQLSYISGSNRTRVKDLIAEILSKIILKQNLFVCYDSDNKHTFVKGDRYQAFITIADKELSLPRNQLQSILAHEIAHVLSNDLLKGIFIDTAKFILITYSAMFIIIYLIVAPTITSVATVLTMVYLIRCLIIWPERLAENTADCVATMMGYGQGLFEFFESKITNITVIQQFLDPHESFPKRKQNVLKIMKNQY